MQFNRIYSTVECHTAGEPLRIVTGGVPPIPGGTMLARRAWVAAELDAVRRALMHEPRGHADMYGCYVTPPVTEGADLGVIFMHNAGYSTMCGHGVIALAAAAVGLGWVRATEPETRVGLDTPAGFVEAFVEWDGARTGQTRFRNVASFLYRRDVAVTTPSFGAVTVDVAFGGAFYAYLDAAQVGLTVRPGDYRALIAVGDEVKHAVEAAIPVVHPLEPELRGIYGTILAGPAAGRGRTRRTCVCSRTERWIGRRQGRGRRGGWRSCMRGGGWRRGRCW